MNRPAMPDDISASAPRVQINPDGLTYRCKPAGSPYSGGAGLQGQTMSCFLCGRHRPRRMLRSRSLVGRTHYVCAHGCGADAA
ncbi:hypothetical protein [Piscinibacter sp.]|uniref:hypothetical protein n=1 Tax=Piscinibacter sp. TaxID=1903157 RepID=UPI0039E3FD62